jgi:hypothetical protein
MQIAEKTEDPPTEKDSGIARKLRQAYAPLVFKVVNDLRAPLP